MSAIAGYGAILGNGTLAILDGAVWGVQFVPYMTRWTCNSTFDIPHSPSGFCRFAPASLPACGGKGTLHQSFSHLRDFVASLRHLWWGKA